MLRKIVWILILVICILITTFDTWRWCRKAIFDFTQVEQCTENGYLKASRRFEPEDMDVELWGRSFLITGACEGVGKSVALVIAEKGATVHMVCENPGVAEEVRKEIVDKSGNENIEVHILGTSVITNVYRFVRYFLLQQSELDVLINTASHVSQERTLTPEGLEKSLAINVIGPYVLTTGLLPLLQKSEHPRVVSLSSYCLLLEELLVNDLNYSSRTFSGHRAYCQQNRIQVVLSEELAKLHPQIHFSTVDPGFLRKSQLTELGLDVNLQVRTPAQGADTIAWAAASDGALLLENGLFYRDRQPISPHLPFGFTEETKKDRRMVMEELARISEQFAPN